MTQAEKQKWEAIRAKGQARYILIEGVLRRGILSGAIITFALFTVGATTHIYTMPVWVGLTLFIILSLFFGVCFGALFWHFEEGNYQKTDDHSPDLKFISKEEIRNILEKIKRRADLRRLLSAILVLAFIFGGLSVLPRSSPYRNYYVWGGILVSWAFVILFFWFNNRGVKNDCYELGAICPKCNKPLFSMNGYPKNFRCSNCGYELFDNS
jgi:energy-coupling factor transporter transmembrane protein EcfT